MTYRREIARVPVHPSFLEDGLTVFPFDTEGALVYNSGAAQKRQWMTLRGRR